ncbi:hypothetical protein BDN72DRAFT_832064 [Pluteus cervinus]|uniref:Uncharacterized protein n=1 Tax=Pluteus cervinus TaxID=181527 RepID=A0ACD3BFB9_9AGAR|nr:hypothetical protein BDN72DRAFT_832064 [Pluteus cervinus]
MLSPLKTVSRLKIARQERDQDSAVSKLGPDMFFEIPSPGSEFALAVPYRLGYLLATIIRHSYGLDKKYENIFNAIKLVKRNKAIQTALYYASECGCFGTIRDLALLQEPSSTAADLREVRDELLSKLQIRVTKPGEWSEDNLRLNDVEVYDATNGNNIAPELEEIRRRLNPEPPAVGANAPCDACETSEAFRSRLLQQLLTPSKLKHDKDLPWEFSVTQVEAPFTSSRDKVIGTVDAVVDAFRFPFALVGLDSIDDVPGGDVRLLLQAAALIRLGQGLFESGSVKRFTTLVIIIGEKVVRRYAVTTQNSSSKVLVEKRTFSRENKRKTSALFAELLNWKQTVDDLLLDLDNKKQDLLLEGYDMISFAAENGINTTGDHEGKKITLNGINSGPLGNSQVKAGLKKLGYTALYRAFDYPEIGVAFTGEGQVAGYLKFIKTRRYEEVLIHERLRGIDSPHNHVVPLIQVWSVPDGNVILTTAEGGWLTGIKEPTKHLWNLARQLFEAIEFLHKHEIGHMGLKPPNLIIPPEYGRLTIIDFGVSIHMSKYSMKHGDCGTPGYKAPEIERGYGSWHPVKADLWAIGKVLSELCQCCEPCLAKDRICDLSNKLMVSDPDERPTMTECLASMAESDNSDTQETITVSQ